MWIVSMSWYSQNNFLSIFFNSLAGERTWDTIIDSFIISLTYISSPVSESLKASAANFTFS
jgi:hypothetical protein